jgi:molybdenum cofactor synthesis domain-containing protein
LSTAAILVVGNEVLSGKVEEENARYLIRELRELGVQLTRVVFVRDELEVIARDVRELSAGADHVFTSGGIGSTHDDVTLDAVARGFGVPMVEDPWLRAQLERHVDGPIDAAVRRMALVPEGTELLGLGDLRFPVVKVRNVFVLPGVPRFLRSRFEYLRPRLRTRPFVLRQVYLGVEEERIAARLADLDAAWPDVELGSYPRFDAADHRVKITVEGRDAARVDAALEALLARLEPGWVVRVE